MFARCGSQMLDEVADDDIVLRHLKDVRGKSESPPNAQFRHTPIINLTVRSLGRL